MNEDRRGKWEKASTEWSGECVGACRARQTKERKPVHLDGRRAAGTYHRQITGEKANGKKDSKLNKTGQRGRQAKQSGAVERLKSAATQTAAEENNANSDEYQKLKLNCVDDDRRKGGGGSEGRQGGGEWGGHCTAAASNKQTAGQMLASRMKMTPGAAGIHQWADLEVHGIYSIHSITRQKKKEIHKHGQVSRSPPE